MAAQADINYVIDNIEPTYQDNGWSNTEITTRLDAGAARERVVAAYWRRRAGQVMLLVNTSESGSSRGNDTLYPRFKTLADEWDAKAEAAENPVSTDTRGRLGSFPIKRV